MLAVGEHLWGHVDERSQRMSTGLGGGVGGSREELCGALSAGALIIGALYGRMHVDEDDSTCYGLVCTFRERFAKSFGATQCSAIRESGYGSEGQWPCSMAVERATRILLEVLRSAVPD